MGGSRSSRASAGDTVLKQRSENNRQELVLLHHADPGDGTQLSILAASAFYPLSYLAGPTSSL